MRTDSINERYYAINNQPSFPQLKKDYHFYDNEGRFYWIVEENDDTFQNKNLRQSPDKGRCVSPSYGTILLNVKLKRGAIWFDENQLDRERSIQTLDGERCIIKIVSIENGRGKRRTGTIEVKGLDKEFCNYLIYQSQFRQRVNL